MSALQLKPFKDFTDASYEVLAYLGSQVPLDLWMVTRRADNEQIVLTKSDHTYGITEGTVFSWTDSFCKRMVEGNAPRIAPRVCDVQAYVDAPGGRGMNIGAYIGIPLHENDGSVFGTLCAINPTPLTDALHADLGTLELMGRLLSTVLSKELVLAESTRLIERTEAEAMRDSLTGLYNRRGWDHFLAAEEDRCRRYGNPACIVVLDLDGLKQINDSLGHDAGDELIRRAGQALLKATRISDVVARTGGDEFCILCVETHAREAEKLLHRLKEEFTAHQVMASMGFAMRRPQENLDAAWKQADQAMYDAKRRR